MASFQWKEPRSLSSHWAVILARNTSSLSLSTDTFSLSVNITKTNSCVTFTTCCFCNKLSIYHLLVYIYFSYCTYHHFKNTQIIHVNKIKIEVNDHNKLEVASSVQFSRSVVSDSLRPGELHHARPPCPSPSPGYFHVFN